VSFTCRGADDEQRGFKLGSMRRIVGVASSWTAGSLGRLLNRCMNDIFSVHSMGFGGVSTASVAC
jgi:hypothetical protein